MTHFFGWIRGHAAALALGAALLAPVSAAAQHRVPLLLPAHDSASAAPLFASAYDAGRLSPSEKLAQRGPVWGTSGDLGFMAVGAAMLFGAYRLKESDHPYLASFVGLVGGLSFYMGFTDLIDPRRYPSPTPRDSAAAW